MLKLNQIHMRDPFVYVEAGQYYLYGTTDRNCWDGLADGFNTFVSKDLENYTPLGSIFQRNTSFWGQRNFWAPELHRYQDAYYLFASFFADGRRRATSILRADKPEGPFVPWGDDSVTPAEWECLDGTLYVDDHGQPWLIFSHEWVQENGGTICARRLKTDLSGAYGESTVLFHAGDASWTIPHLHENGVRNHVTDGPYLYRMKNGFLLMLWSSLSKSGYAIGQAISATGNILGPWEQKNEALFSGDGGHGMLFRTFEGDLLLSIHKPNDSPQERPLFIPVQETEEGLILK